MASILTLFEIQLIVDSSHCDPHQILGMHEVGVNGNMALSVRVFIPDAKKITCIDAKDEAVRYTLHKVHKGGFFEVTIANRREWFRYKLEVKDKEGAVWLIYDAFSFMPTITDYDIYLFAQGNHYEIYDKLGAHLTEVDGIPGVMFGTWAPNALRVSIIGDFNKWDGRRHAMRNLNNSGVWEIFIPGLCEYDKYKFEIKAQDGSVFEKSDPYCNYAELRPSTASMVYDINKYKWNDTKWIKKRAATDLLQGPVNIYEVHLGSWKRPEDDNGRSMSYMEAAEELIPYVKEMGYTHIGLMPVMEYPYDGSWGYQVTGYFAPTSRYGKPDEFMAFVDVCHEAGIGVLLDWVPALFPKDMHGLACFDGTPLYEDGDMNWNTSMFNYERNEVRNFLISSALFWIEKFHVDGLRAVAISSMLYLEYGYYRNDYIPHANGGRENYYAVEFLKHLNSAVLRRNKNVLMIAEESTSWPGVTRPPETGGLGFNLKWNLGWIKDILEYMLQDPLYRKYYNNNLTFSMIYNYSDNFVLPLSHEEVVRDKKSMLDKMPGEIRQKFANLRLAYGFMFGHPGKKLLFMGGEFGQTREWKESQGLDWYLLDDANHKGIKDYIQDMNHLYLKYDALWFQDYDFSGFQWINSKRPEESVVSFIRTGKNESNKLVFVCNFTPVVRENFRVGVPIAGQYVEIMNSDNEKYGGTGVVNAHAINSEAIACDNQDNSIDIILPPLGITILKYKAAK